MWWEACMWASRSKSTFGDPLHAVRRASIHVTISQLHSFPISRHDFPRGTCLKLGVLDRQNGLFASVNKALPQVVRLLVDTTWGDSSCTDSEVGLRSTFTTSPLGKFSLQSSSYDSNHPYKSTLKWELKPRFTFFWASR